MSGNKLMALVASSAAAAMLAGCGQPPVSTNTTTTTNTTATTNTTLVVPSNAATEGGAGDTADAADAKAFVEGLYAHYKTGSSSSTWAPMDANAKDVMDADLIKLMADDTKALKGELGVIDGDWICDCQDWESITANVTVSEASATEAKAVSVFTDKADAGGPPKRVTFDLVKTPGGWRVHDIGTEIDPSLRAMLTKEISDLKSGKYKSPDAAG